MAILLDMSRVHVPVLAGELIDLTAPAPGETAVDCTFGAGGHARLVADRLGPTGTLVCIDRDPAAQRQRRSAEGNTEHLTVADVCRSRCSGGDQTALGAQCVADGGQHGRGVATGG